MIADVKRKAVIEFDKNELLRLRQLMSNYKLIVEKRKTDIDWDCDDEHFLEILNLICDEVE